MLEHSFNPHKFTSNSHTLRVSVTRVFMLEQRNFPVEAALTALTVTVVPGCGRGWGGAQPNMRKV